MSFFTRYMKTLGKSEIPSQKVLEKLLHID